MFFPTLSCVALIAVTTIASATYHEEYGYGGTCVPGYDEGCDFNQPQTIQTTEEEESSTLVPSTSAPFVPNDVGTTTAAEPSVTVSTEFGCKFELPKECVFPFIYKNIEYDKCTGADANDLLWCSTDKEYKGHHKRCTSCLGKVRVKEIVGGVLAGSVAATGIGLIATAIHNQVKNGEFKIPPLLAAGGNASTVPTPAPAPMVAAQAAPTAPPLVLKQPDASGPGVEVVSIPISVPVSARLLSEVDAKTSQGFLAPGAPASATWTWALAAAGLFAAVALVGGFGKFMRSRAAQKEEQPSLI